VAFEESQQRQHNQTRYDEELRREKERRIKVYQGSQKEACPCHCHLEWQGVTCKCIKNCEHCRPADAV
jgi:hypothetical protein